VPTLSCARRTTSVTASESAPPLRGSVRIQARLTAAAARTAAPAPRATAVRPAPALGQIQSPARRRTSVTASAPATRRLASARTQRRRMALRVPTATPAPKAIPVRSAPVWARVPSSVWRWTSVMLPAFATRQPARARPQPCPTARAARTATPARSPIAARRARALGRAPSCVAPSTSAMSRVAATPPPGFVRIRPSPTARDVVTATRARRRTRVSRARVSGAAPSYAQPSTNVTSLAPVARQPARARTRPKRTAPRVPTGIRALRATPAKLARVSVATRSCASRWTSVTP
jgi:hypothetical protein